MRKFLVTVLVLVFAMSCLAQEQQVSDAWNNYYMTKAGLSQCDTVECITSTSDAVGRLATFLQRDDLVEWAQNNRAYYLIQLFKKNTDYDNTMAMLDFGYRANLEKVKSVMLPNLPLLDEAIAALTSRVFVHRGSREMAKSNLDFCIWIKTNIIEKEFNHAETSPTGK